MKSKTLRPIFAIVNVLVLAAISCQLALPDFVGQAGSPEPGALPTVEVSQDLLSQQDALISLYQTVSPGVVSIFVATEQGGGQGSGFVYDTEGHIITNYHVVEGATYIEVAFPSGDKSVGEVVGVDTDSDIAVIRVDASADVLHPLTMGDSGELLIGQYVVAIGNPFGLSGSMSVGIISSLGRSLDSINQAPDSGAFFAAGDIIQTDAAINPGNSGGPLLNLNGEVVGINRAIRSFNFTDEGNALNSGIGFAISINIVKRVVPSLIAEGHYDYPYLGVSSAPELTLAAAQELGLDRTEGVLITQVVDGGPADEAGVLPGDLIISLDGLEVKNFDELIAYLFENKSPSDTVFLVIIRDGEQISIDLVLGARP